MTQTVEIPKFYKVFWLSRWRLFNFLHFTETRLNKYDKRSVKRCLTVSFGVKKS